MTPEARRALAERLLAHLEEAPTGAGRVVELAGPQELVDAFADGVGLGVADDEPAHTEAELLDAVDAVVRWSVHTADPAFLNQNFAGADPVAVLGDWLGATLNTTGATYEVAPVFTMMERAVLRKLARIAGLPVGDPDGPPPGLFCAGGSLATLHALQLARHRRDPSIVTTGATGRLPAVFVSTSGHYSTAKAASLLGMGSGAVVEVAATDEGAMRPDALVDAVAAATAAGREPLAVVATAGTTVTAAFDPLEAVADVCVAHGMWLHVDGCYGASALFSPSYRHLLAGVDRADSLVWNLHKMMGMTQQCTALLLREPGRLAECFATGADYLFQPDKAHADLDAGDRTFQCGRRVDVVKLWLAWKARGDAGFAARVEHAVALADHARARVAASDGVLAAVMPGRFTNVCLTWVPPELRPLDLDRLSPADHARLHGLAPRVKRRMQADGRALIGYQPVRGLNVFRLIFMNPVVTVDHVDGFLELLVRYGEEEWR